MNEINFLNIKNLKIARENIGLSTRQATDKVCSKAIKTDKVAEWEKGTMKPTWKQLEKLANKYDINLFLLTSEEQITKNKKIHDFRRKTSDEEPSVTKFLNLLLMRQEFISNILKEDSRKNRFVGLGSDIKNAEKLASFISKEIDFDINKLFEIKKQEDKFKYLISCLEDNGIFVMKTLSSNIIARDAMQGVYISNAYAPFIATNNSDSKTSQMFTLGHELAHLFIDKEGISDNVNIDFRKKGEYDEIEFFCNRVASNLLLPKEKIEEKQYTVKNINTLAAKHGVSPLATFYRLKDLGFINKNEIDSYEKEIKKEMQISLRKRAKSKKTGGDYNNNMKHSNGNLFTNFISSLYFENRLNAFEAGKALKMSITEIDL